jgi:hypothetical protein
MGNWIGAFRVLMEGSVGRDRLEDPGVDGRINIKIGLEEVRWGLGLD